MGDKQDTRQKASDRELRGTRNRSDKPKAGKGEARRPDRGDSLGGNRRQQDRQGSLR